MSSDYIKLIYITDVHEANKQLRYLFQKTTADLYLVSGDLLYRSLYSYDLIYEFISLQEEFYSRDSERTPYFQAEQILRQGQETDWFGMAERYLYLYYNAAKNMKEKYQILEEIFVKYCSAPVYVIPGNYDMDLDQTALQYRNIHKKSIFYKGYKISGFGGADVRTLGIPEKLTVRYQEGDGKPVEHNPAAFFRKEKSNIMVIHKPVYGRFDRLTGYGNSGSLSLVNLLEEKGNPSCLVVSGHVHHDRGVHNTNGTLFTNPGNFGRTLQAIGFSDGGFFAEIHLSLSPPSEKHQGCVRKVIRYALQKGQINQLKEYDYRQPQGYWPKLSLFEDIKFFFRQFETPDTKKRVRDFIQIARAIQKNGESIAFELLGSVNFGMSNTKSDVDLVMYHMCNPKWECNMEKCPKSKHYQFLLLHTLLYEVADDRYPLEVVDCINLRKVLNAIDRGDSNDDFLIRFAFYRRIGRAVNKRLLHIIDRILANHPQLKAEVDQKLDGLFVDISYSSMEKKSLDKYGQRLVDMGITLPPAIRKKIFYYLGQEKQK